METREYFEKVMQDYNQNRNGRSLRKYCKDEAIDYNWLHIGSYMAAQNVAFMYSLYESCRLNNINFGKYLNDILTRMMKGDTNYMTMLPCNYVAQEHEDELKVKECA